VLVVDDATLPLLWEETTLLVWGTPGAADGALCVGVQGPVGADESVGGSGGLVFCSPCCLC